jgi:hypothetical protein
VSKSSSPRPIIPPETTAHIEKRARLAADVIVAAAVWIELPSSGLRLGHLLDSIEALAEHVRTR